MTEFTIKSTADFRQVWPDLKRTDRFKRSIDGLFDNGTYEFAVKVAGEGPGKSFKAKDGKTFRAVIRYNGKGRCIQRKYMWYGSVVSDPVGWASIGRVLGQLIGDEFIHSSDCPGCKGTGVKSQFMHVANGLCFDCMGVGKFLRIESTSV